MNQNFVSHVRNVNDALNQVMKIIELKDYWRSVAPRGMETLEWKGVFITEYEKPDERVLFSAARDANPYFHFFEALWILAGRQDVEFLAQFNSQISKYSDDGVNFHAAYGYRLRKHFDVDQILLAIDMLKADHDTRQVVLQVWDMRIDLSFKTKDMPCNDLMFLKIRDGGLNISVCCRSNDIFWGAYGANAVQFSTLQEFIARAVGVNVGTYTQISDSFHIYMDDESSTVFKRLQEKPYSADTYATMSAMKPYPLMEHNQSGESWLKMLHVFIDEPSHCEEHPDIYDGYFPYVTLPLWKSWVEYKRKDYDRAFKELADCRAYDWATACGQWIQRRIAKKAVV